jgi:hypothetical protein
MLSGFRIPLLKHWRPQLKRIQTNRQVDTADIRNVDETGIALIAVYGNPFVREFIYLLLLGLILQRGFGIEVMESVDCLACLERSLLIDLPIAS